MLIQCNDVIQLLNAHGVKVTGVIHVGAHDCEELPFYRSLGLPDKSIVWIDAMQNKVNDCKVRNIPNVYQAVISDIDDQLIKFNVTNNGQSSSILEFGTHAVQHPHVVVNSVIELATSRLDTFLNKNNIDPTLCNFWNFDIQGAELLALRGATSALKHCRAIYIEVNVEELYIGCAKMDEIDAFLGPMGFKRVKTLMTHHGWGDALYVR